MNGSLRTRFARSAFVILVSTALAMCAMAQEHGDEREIARAAKQLALASDVLEKMMKRPDRFIPQDLLDEADAIAVFPRVIKDTFIKGGGADGIVVRRLENGWSMPVFYNLSGSSFGPQIGVKKADYIVLFMNDDAIEYLQDERFELGSDVSFAAGPVGQTPGTDARSQPGVLTWLRSGGAFVGASIPGAAITPDNDRNLAVYGIMARDLITSSTIVLKRTVSRETSDYSWRSTRD